MTTAHDRLVWRVKVALEVIAAPENMTLDELCGLVWIHEAAADRGPGPAENVIAFAGGRSRRTNR